MEFTRFTIVSGIYIRGDSVLLVSNLWGSHSDWSLPGGRIEPGESVQDALRREFLEETGIALSGINQLCYVVQSRVISLHEEALILTFEVTAEEERTSRQKDDLIENDEFVKFGDVGLRVRNPANRVPLCSFLTAKPKSVPFYYFDEIEGEIVLSYECRAQY